MKARTHRNRFRPALHPVHALEDRALPSTLILLDFNGATQAEVNAAAARAPAWPGRPTAGGLVGFVQGFPLLNAEYARYSFLDFDADGDLDAIDGENTLIDVLDRVREDFAPYDVVVRREDSTARALDAMRRNGANDTLIFVNGGSLATGGQTPRDDVGNSGEDVGAAGDTLGIAQWAADSEATDAHARDWFVNALATFVAHEAGHSFGLHHLDTAAEPGALDRNIMDPFLADRNAAFWDVSLQTDAGLQNQHRELTRVLGPSRLSWAAVLRPGVLTVQAARSAASSYDAFAGADPAHVRLVDGSRLVAYEVDTGAVPDINSLNQFPAAVTLLRFVGGSAADHLNVPADVGLDVYADGAGGADHIAGGGGGDVLLGGRGDDTLTGGPGNDFILGGGGADTVDGGDDDDFISAEGGQDVLRGGAGDDTCDGGTADDLVFGQSGDDVLFGGAGHDVLVGGSGFDQLHGGIGRDILVGGTFADELYGGAGEDIVIGGSTAHDADETALRALRSEWAHPTRSHSRRIDLLRAGGGLNGSYRLELKSVVDDGSPDTLLGEADRDWFWSFGDTSDRVILFGADETDG